MSMSDLMSLDNFEHWMDVFTGLVVDRYGEGHKILVTEEWLRKQYRRHWTARDTFDNYVDYWSRQ